MPLFSLPHTHHVIATLFLLLSLFACSLTNAHETTPSVVNITIDENQQYHMSIRLNLEAMIAKIGDEHNDDTNDSDKSHIYDGLRQMPFNELIEEFAEFEPELLKNISLRFNNKIQAISVDSVDIPHVGDLELARTSIIHFKGSLPANTTSMSWQWDSSYGNAVLLVGIEKEPELHSSFLVKGKSSGEVTLVETTSANTWNPLGPIAVIVVCLSLVGLLWFRKKRIASPE